MSQDSAMGDTELDDLQNSVQPINTNHQTSWGMKCFFLWLDKRRVNINMETISSNEQHVIIIVSLCVNNNAINVHFLGLNIIMALKIADYFAGHNHVNPSKVNINTLIVL